MPDVQAMSEGSTLNVDAANGVLANDVDADGDTLHAELNNGPSYGLVTLHPNGSFDYKPNTGFSGTDSFTYHANDGVADSGIVTVTINVAGPNDAPVNHIPDSSYTAHEDTPLVIAGITVTDVDSGASPIVTRFEVLHGTLSVDATVPGVTVLGNGTGVLQIVGTTTQINDTLAKPTGLTYTPTAGYIGGDSLKMVTNDLGATGSGLPQTDTDIVPINVLAVNDAPENHIPNPAYATNEDTVLLISGITVTDVDSDPSPIVTRFEVQHGTLTVDPSTPGVVVLGNGTSVLQIVGTTSQINATLALPAGLTYTPGANFNGADSLKMITNDLGSTGLGGPLIDTDIVAINVNAVNDAPVNTLPAGPYATNEDTALVLSGISVADVDSDPSPIVTRFEVQHGVLSVDPSVPGVVVLGNGTNVLQIIGTTTQINDTLAKPTGLTYTPTADFNGADQLNMVTNDLGATGAGGPLSDTDLRDINVSPVNDAPINNLPLGPYAMNEDTTLVISGVSVTDVDSGLSPVVTRFEVLHGTLTVDTSVPGVVVLGNGTNVLQIVGTIAQINATLALPMGLTYSPVLNYNGADQLKMVTNDVGATGSGGPMSDTDTLDINIAAVNDAPVNSLPAGPYATNEDIPLVISGITVTDVDSDPSPIVTRFEVQYGALTVDTSVPGVVVLGNGTKVLQIIGTVAQINATLALPTALTYTPDLNYNGGDQLKMITNDLGSTGIGGPLADTDFRDITIVAVNDPPVNSLPAGPYATNEDTTLVIAGVSVSDVDSDPSPVVTRLEVLYGTLTVDPSVPGIVVLGNGTNVVQIVGTIAQINATLALPTGLTYSPNLDFNGVDQLKMVTNDLGATGLGGPMTDTDVRDINVIAVNDPPVNSLPPGPYATNEDTTLVLTGVTVSDVDSDPSPIVTRFEVQHGTLTVDTSIPGVIVLGNGTNVLQIIGTQAQINATLALPTGLSYLPTANYGGPDMLTMVTNDLGATGIGGPLSDTDFRDIDVIPVADTPILVIVSPANGVEGSPTPLSISAVLGDNDGSESLTYFISGFPIDAILVDGLNVVRTGSTSYAFTPAEIAGLTVQMADDATFVLTVTAYATEQLNGDFAASAPGALQVIIANVAPTITSLTITPGSITEGNWATINGTYSDPGVLDTFVLIVDWGDGTVEQIYAVIPGGINPEGQITGSFTASHYYADDNPSGTHEDVNMVHVTVRDDDGGNGVADTYITVIDIDPVLFNLTGSVFVVGGKLTITGTAFDVGVQDVLTLHINWGDVTEQVVVAQGNFSITHFYLEAPDPLNASAPITVFVTLADDDSGTDSGSTVSAIAGLGNTQFFIASMYIDPAPRLESAGVKFDVVPFQQIIIPAANLPFDLRPPRDGGLKVGEAAVLLIPVDAVTGKERDAVVLPVTVLDRLPDLFAKLPDGQYHLYYADQGHQRLIMDVVVRGGRPIDPTDDSEGTQDRPPTATQAEKLRGGTQQEDAAPKPKADAQDAPPPDTQTPPDGTAPNGAFYMPGAVPGQISAGVAEIAKTGVTSLTMGPIGTDPHQNLSAWQIPQTPTAASLTMMDESDGCTDRAASGWRRATVAPAVMAVASAAIWSNGRWARQVEADLSQASPGALSKAARLRRKLRRGLDA